MTVLHIESVRFVGSVVTAYLCNGRHFFNCLAAFFASDVNEESMLLKNFFVERCVCVRSVPTRAVASADNNACRDAELTEEKFQYPKARKLESKC
jgi:hypothetical protein